METRKSFCTLLLLRLLLILMITFNAKIVRSFNREWMPILVLITALIQINVLSIVQPAALYVVMQ